MYMCLSIYEAQFNLQVLESDDILAGIHFSDLQRAVRRLIFGFRAQVKIPDEGEATL